MKLNYLLTLIAFFLNPEKGICYLKDFEFAENILIENLKNYITQFEGQISNLKLHLNNYLNEHKIAAEDSEAYLANPINAYLLTKRLTVDWKNVQSIMVNTVGKDIVNNITDFETTYGKVPNKNDYNHAVMELIRIKEIYNLNVHEIANGKLDDIQYSRPLTWKECFEIGRQLVVSHKYLESIEWFEETLNKLQKKSISNDKKISLVYEFLSWSKYKIGDLKEAIELGTIALKYNPDSYEVQSNLKIFRLGTSRLESGLKLKNKIIIEEKLDEDELFYKGCRNELHKSPMDLSSLYCQYYDHSNSFLILAPFKMEEINLDPYIVRFHDIISDDEINNIKENTKHILRPGTLWSPKLQEQASNKMIRSNYATFLNSNSNPILEKLDIRLRDITGLNMDLAEEYNIVKYDIGGYYNLHNDYFTIDDKSADGNKQQYNEYGNRLATVLIYLSDVAKGGATVFPYLRTVIQPKKYSAVFWYNLNHGLPDPRTKHGACPVLKGTKWVINKWIREKGQFSNSE